MIVWRCPECESSEGLWQALHVSGWQTLDSDGKPDKSKRDVDWAWVNELTEGGCAECGWDGTLDQMTVALGIDSKPLPEVHPAQQEIQA